MLEVNDLQSGKIYRNTDGELVYLLKILFEDVRKKHPKDFEADPVLPLYDYIVYRKLKEGRYDFPYKGNYRDTPKFIEEVDLPVLFNKNYNRHYVEHENFNYDIEFLCRAGYTKDTLHCQAKPYKFYYKLLIGKEFSSDKPNFDIMKITLLVNELANTLGFESFVYFEHVSPSMIGGTITVMGYTFWFQKEEDLNLAKLVLPLKFIHPAVDRES